MIFFRCDTCQKQVPAELERVPPGDAWAVAHANKPIGWLYAQTQKFVIVACSKACADRRMTFAPENDQDLLRRALELR